MTSRSVVFGTGQIGRLVAGRLVALGHDVVAVNRTGRAVTAGAVTVPGDATDARFTAQVAAKADTVYFCLNATHYDRWAQEFPPLQRGVLAGAQAAGARLVVLDNLYSYGPSRGKPLVETMPARPTSAKSATRAAMTTELLAADRAGRAEVVIGRASDFFGPGTTASALGESVFGSAVAGRRAQVMGDPDLLHSYSYTPDVAAALVTLGTTSGTTGQIWHLPVAEARTTRALVADIYSRVGRRPRLLAAGDGLLRLIGAVAPAMREYRHTLYQFAEPWVLDDAKYRTRFGAGATTPDDAIDSTLQWFGSRAAPANRTRAATDSTPQHAHR